VTKNIFFSVKNMEKFQHYTDRTPPWIKLYNDVLEDYDFATLPDASKIHLIMIWLLASRSENKVVDDPDWIARKINATEPVNLELLKESGFIVEYDSDLENAKKHNFSSRYISKTTREFVRKRLKPLGSLGLLSTNCLKSLLGAR